MAVGGLKEWLSSLHAAAFAHEFEAQGFSTVEECVSCITDEADLQSSLKIRLLKTRRDLWQELCRQRRLCRDSEVAGASTSDLHQPLSAWLADMRLGQYCAHFEARGLDTTLKVRPCIRARTTSTQSPVVMALPAAPLLLLSLVSVYTDAR